MKFGWYNHKPNKSKPNSNAIVPTVTMIHLRIDHFNLLAFFPVATSSIPISLRKCPRAVGDTPKAAKDALIGWRPCNFPGSLQPIEIIIYFAGIVLVSLFSDLVYLMILFI